MPTLKQIPVRFLLVLTLLTTAAAQDSTTQKSTLTITASASGERVRITAPSSVVQMHVEVYAAGGEKLFDQEIRGGNVFDWHLQDGQAQRLAPGNYVCVVTAKSISGKLTQKIGAVTVAEKSASVLPAESAQLSPLQAQTIGPVEENSSWTVATKDEPRTPTVIANDGTDGQMIRGRGALTFRIGNFFSGIDQEQMRLTEEGNLGIGTSSPQSKLDVAGAIRAERFLVVKPNKSGSDKTAADTLAADGTDSVQPLVSGTGTAGRLTKWTDGSGTLADSVVTEASNNIGISNTNPVNKLDITDTNVTPGSAAINISGTAAIASTKYGVYSDLSGASTTNIAGFFDARGATNNYGLIVNRGNVGIGTTGPIAKLQVSAGNIRLDNTQQLEFGGGVDSISGSNGLHSLTLWTNNIARLHVNNLGNVGLGTTSPDFKLDVADRMRVRQGASSSAGMWLFQTVPGSDRAFVGMQDDNHVGLWGNTGAGWGLTMDTSLGNVGLGTTTPGFKLHVIDQANAGLRVQTNSAGGSVASFGGFGDFQVDAAGISGGRFLVKESGNVGIGTQIPNEKLTVNGKIESISGGFKFPDGTVQTTSANTTFTKLRGPNLTPFTMLGGNGNAGQSSAILLTVATGTYVVTATVEFRNNVNNFGQNNSRRITCNLSNNDPFSFDMESSTRRTVSFQTVQSVVAGTFNVGLFCFHSGAVGDSVETATARITAVKIEGTVFVQTDP